MKPVIAKIINSGGQDIGLYLTYCGGEWDLTRFSANAYVFNDRSSAIAKWNEIRSSRRWIAEIPADMKPVDW
jgi:hypothetical protein